MQLIEVLNCAGAVVGGAFGIGRWSVRVKEQPIETTIYSISAEPPTESNRRTDERQMTLFRVGTMVVGSRRELCLVKNVSAGGALVRAYCSLEPDMIVQIELKEGQPIAGRVTWTRATDAGITFAEPVDVVDLLKTTADGLTPRMPRVEVDCVGFVREGAVARRSLVRNISQGGVNVDSSTRLTVGADVTVSLPGLPPQSAVVRWNDGKRYGITFNTVLPLAGLVEWLHARQDA